MSLGGTGKKLWGAPGAPSNSSGKGFSSAQARHPHLDLSFATSDLKLLPGIGKKLCGWPAIP